MAPELEEELLELEELLEELELLEVDEELELEELLVLEEELEELELLEVPASSLPQPTNKPTISRDSELIRFNPCIKGSLISELSEDKLHFILLSRDCKAKRPSSCIY